jgi:hypothetical protein
MPIPPGRVREPEAAASYVERALIHKETECALRTSTEWIDDGVWKLSETRSKSINDLPSQERASDRRRRSGVVASPYKDRVLQGPRPIEHCLVRRE